MPIPFSGEGAQLQGSVHGGTGQRLRIAPSGRALDGLSHGVSTFSEGYGFRRASDRLDQVGSVPADRWPAPEFLPKESVGEPMPQAPLHHAVAVLKLADEEGAGVVGGHSGFNGEEPMVHAIGSGCRAQRAPVKRA